MSRFKILGHILSFDNDISRHLMTFETFLESSERNLHIKNCKNCVRPNLGRNRKLVKSFAPCLKDVALVELARY